MGTRVAIAAIIFGLVLPTASSAEPFGNAGGGADTVERFQRQLDLLELQTTVKADTSIPLGQRTQIDYGGYLSADYVSFDDPRRDNHALRQFDLVGYARANIDGVHEFFGRARFSYQDYNPGDSFDDGDHQTQQVLEIGYYRFDLQRALAAYSGIKTNNDLAFEGGRQFIYWGNGLSLTQTIDGATVDATVGSFQAQAIAGVTPVRTIDFDFSRPGFDHHTLRGFYGVMLSARVPTPLGEQHPFVYALGQQDYNHGDTLVSGPPGETITTRFHYNSYYLGLGSRGTLTDRLVYGVEAVHEGGRGLSASSISTPQSENDINAYSADVRLDYVLNNPARTRFSSEFVYATGDVNRQVTNNTLGGSKPGTIDTAYNGFGLLDTGVAFNPDVSNLFFLRVGASMFPLNGVSQLKNLQIGGDLFYYLKANRRAPIDEPTSDGSYLGVEPDIYMNWQIASDITLVARYGVFLPNAHVFPSSAARQFFYTSLTFAF